jgi:hypothetical protein
MVDNQLKCRPAYQLHQLAFFMVPLIFSRKKGTSGIHLYINQTFELAEHSTEVGLHLKFRDAVILVVLSDYTGRITRKAIKLRLSLITLIT